MALLSGDVNPVPQLGFRVWGLGFIKRIDNKGFYKVNYFKGSSQK